MGRHFERPLRVLSSRSPEAVKKSISATEDVEFQNRKGSVMPTQYERMAHLLSRAAFGARPDEINEQLKQGFEATVEQLVNYENTPEHPPRSTTPNGSTGRTSSAASRPPAISARC